MPHDVTVSVPLNTGTDGVIRLAGTRVTLDTVTAAYDNGSSAEDIIRQYPSLQLADVHSIISYILQHRSEVDEYLKQRETIRKQARIEAEIRFPQEGIRARLMARRQQG